MDRLQGVLFRGFFFGERNEDAAAVIDQVLQSARSQVQRPRIGRARVAMGVFHQFEFEDGVDILLDLRKIGRSRCLPDAIGEGI
jgi:hypothetical protein